MTRRYRKDHDLMGYEADDLLSVFDSLTEADIWQYRYPEEAALEQVGVRGLYLGNYVRWDPLAQHLQMVKEAGYQYASLPRTFDTFDHVDDWHYMGLHDCIKTIKTGYGKVTDQASREIRHGRLTRDQAQNVVAEYLATPPVNTELLMQWLGFKKNGLSFILSHISKDLIDAHPTSKGGRNLTPDTTTTLERHDIIGKGYP